MWGGLKTPKNKFVFLLTIAIPQDSSSFTSSWVFLVLHFSSFLFSTFSFLPLYNFSGFPFPHSVRFFPFYCPGLPNFFFTFSLTVSLSSFLHPHIFNILFIYIIFIIYIWILYIHIFINCSPLSFMATNQKHQKCKKGTRHSQTNHANITFLIFSLNLSLFSSFSCSARKSISSFLL